MNKKMKGPKNHEIDTSGINKSDIDTIAMSKTF